MEAASFPFFFTREGLAQDWMMNSGLRELVEQEMKGLNILNRLMISFSLFLLLGSIVYAQKPNLEFKPFDPLDAITSSKTSVMIEDSLGYMWIGTEEGLFRFDGQSIFPYVMDVNNPKSLPSNGINNLVLDNENNLWIVEATSGQSQQVTGDGLTSNIDWK